MDKVLSLLSIAAKGGNIKSGEFSVEESIKTYKAWLVIIAGDASENTKKKFSDMCKFRDIPFVTYSTKEALARALGKDYRSVAAIIDQGLAQAVISKLDQ